LRQLFRSGAAPAAPALLAVLTVLAGCGSPGTDQVNCPTVEVLRGLDRYVQYRDGPGRDTADIAYTANIADVRSSCKIDQPGVTTDMRIAIVGERGPAGGKLESGEIVYFIAILDSKRNIINKRPFTERLQFNEQGQARLADDLEEFIPLPITKSARGDSIIVGFQLTPEQVDLNEVKPQ
jgi:hypothetical protein